ncbi:hypothetical protein [Pseudomonas paraversuta]|uniref:hypothetical protein n=1 Tax=Pseudomonas paraversuta TaxID=2750624 RepID=UPI001922FE5F|nr:hypothetical protein [Pseudomonas paraversuta]
MDNNLVSLFEILVILTLIGAQVFDVYAVMVRARVNVDGTTQVLAVANWVQYLARIMNMVSVFSISLLLEKKITTIGVPAMFGYSMCAGLLFIIFVCRSKYASQPLKYLQILGFTGIFGALGKKQYWWRVEWDVFSKVTMYSVFVSLLINLAIIMPFVLSIKYPEIRMTLAYTGQLLNFCASIIMFTYIDRVFFKALDVGNEINCAARIITGKLIGQMVLVAGVVVAFYVLKV